MKILRIPLVIVLVVLAGRVFNARAQTETILYSFVGSPDGASPVAGLVQGSDSNFYGTTKGGGTDNICAIGCGTVFRISPSSSYTNLYSFGSSPTDGVYPVAGLAQGSDGNFYGTTELGGDATGCSGTAFRISPSGSETNFYEFGSGYCQLHEECRTCDGVGPEAGLVLGSDGNFYGTTSGGGTGTNCDNGCGTVFRISPSGTYTSLYSFVGYTNDASVPRAGLVQGSDGNFYGTTSGGGTGTNSNCSSQYGGCGTVFRISPSGSETILYSFAGPPNDGDNPVAGLVQGSDGNFYGTTESGGTNKNSYCYYCGTVFRISPSGSYTNLYSFGSYPTDGRNPQAGLVQGSDGNFYGTTQQGGTNKHGNYGTIFRISPSGSYTSLYSFTGYPTDGASPVAGLVQGSDGNFYGTTSGGGTNNGAGGTVFKFSLCNSNFMPQVSAIQIVGTNVVVTLPTVTCQTYQLQDSESMTPANWIDTGSVVAGTGNPIQLIDLGGALQTQRFYQVEVTTGGGSSPSIAGETYQLLRSSSMIPTNWVNVPGVSATPSFSGLLTVTNFGGGVGPQGFYRFAITP